MSTSYKYEKDDNPMVSVIVLTYNNFDNIEANIRSIQCQDYDNIEIIIHDDCSDSFPKEKIIQLLSQKETKNGYQIEQNAVNQGTVKNYNNAIKIAKGDIIVPLAQDDRFLDNSCVSTIVNHFVKTDCWVCTGNRIGESSKKRNPNKSDALVLSSGIDNRILMITMTHNIISGSVMYINKKKFVDAWTPLFDENYFLLEDYPFVYKCLKNNIHIDYINKDMIIYGEKGVAGSDAGVSTRVLKDEITLFENEILPSLGLINSKTVKKYIQYNYLKMVDMVISRDGRKSNKSLLFLIKNIKLAMTIIVMIIMNKLGHNRYNIMFKMEEKARRIR